MGSSDFFLSNISGSLSDLVLLKQDKILDRQTEVLTILREKQEKRRRAESLFESPCTTQDDMEELNGLLKDEERRRDFVSLTN